MEILLTIVAIALFIGVIGILPGIRAWNDRMNQEARERAEREGR